MVEVSDRSEFAEHASPWPFVETVERLTQVIADHGMTIFARIDHAANARAVGMTMPPTTVLVYGNARVGTPIMIATPQAALDLPLHVLVRECVDGATAIGFHPVATMLGHAGVPANTAARLDPAQRMLLEALVP